MKITEIIQKSQELSEDWLERGMLMDAENCNCDKCKKVVEIIKNKSEALNNLNKNEKQS